MGADVYLTRQPVLNKQRAITANRILVHAASSADAAAALTGLADVWPRERTVFVGLRGALPDAGLLAWSLPDNVLLEFPAAALSSADGDAAQRALAAAGARLCLDGWTPATALPAGLQATFTLVDPALDPNSADAPGLVLARGLPDAAAFEQALKRGFDGACGWFFLHATPGAKKLAPAHGQIVRLINLVRKNADLKEIEAVLKQDVALSFKLLRYINSAGFGLSCEIQSFRHAVTMLGYEKLNKWLSLLLVTASKDASAPALMQASVARGRFLELVAAPLIDKSELDNLFIAGAFSLLGALLNVPLAAVLDEMHLPEPVCDALLHRQGSYGPFFELALACEGEDPAAVARVASALGLTAEDSNRALLTALSFADSMQMQ